MTHKCFIFVSHLWNIFLTFIRIYPSAQNAHSNIPFKQRLQKAFFLGSSKYCKYCFVFDLHEWTFKESWSKILLLGMLMEKQYLFFACFLPFAFWTRKLQSFRQTKSPLKLFFHPHKNILNNNIFLSKFKVLFPVAKSFKKRIFCSNGFKQEMMIVIKLQ